jgi:photosystem II stability/assembly factor-like uncharacterized protein
MVSYFIIERGLQHMRIITFLSVSLVFCTLLHSQNWVPAGTVTNPGIRPSISVSGPNTAWIADGGTTTPKIFKTTNGGLNWLTVPVAGITNEIFCIWAISADAAFVGEGVVNGGAKLLRTTNGGTNWTVILTTGNSNGHFTGLAFTKGIGNRFGLAIAERIYRSANFGNNWVELNPGTVGVSNAQNSLMIVDNDFYGFGLNNGSARIRMTTDNSGSWTTKNVSITGNYTSAIAFHTGKLMGVAATSTSLPVIGRTTDGGTTWTNVDVGTNISGTSFLSWVPYTPVIYILGQNGTIKRSTDNGLTWVVTPTPGVTNLTHFDFHHLANVVYGYAVSSSGNVIKLADTLVILTGVNNNQLPADYSLSQNYPNPFNPVTSIGYSIPAAADVKLAVFDALGREVDVIVNENKPAGNYEAVWNAVNFPSGVYFYRLTAGEFTDTKKLMLIK